MAPQTLALSDITVADFLAAFFPDYTESVHVRAFKPRGAPDTPEFKAEKLTFTREQLENDYEITRSLQQLNRTRGLYFVVNAGGQSDNEINRYNAVFAEIDDRPMQEQHRLFDMAPLAPSVRVETKKSVHAYWLLNESCSQEDWRDIQHRLIAYFKGDEKIKNPSRVMRLPFFNHLTYTETGLQTKTVRLVEFQTHHRYSVAQLQQAFPPSPRSLTSATAQEARPTTYTSWDQLSTELKSRIMRHPTAKMQADGWWHCKGVCHDGRGGTAVMFNPASGAVKCMSGCEYRDLLVAFGLPDRPSEPTIYIGTGNVVPFAQPKHETEQAGEDKQGEDEADTLVYSWGALKNRAFAEGEKIIATLERGECGMMVALPSAGKTTLSLNLALSLITGREFAPLTPPDAPPRRVLILDAETSKARWQRDVWRMTAGFTEDELSLIDDHLHVIAEAEIAGEAVTLSDPTHLGIVARAAMSVQPDLIVIDTLSQFFVLFDENANAEAARKVWRPLQKLARMTRAAILVLHHYGKAGDNTDTAAVYRGRGASASGGAARFIMLLKPQPSDPDTVTLVNAKAKGLLFEDVKFRLDREARWFKPVPPRREEVRDANADLVLGVITEPLNGNQIAKKLEGLLSRASVYRYLRELYDAEQVLFADGVYAPIPNAPEMDF